MSEHRDHPSYLGHHYDTAEQQFDSGKLGMWLFLATEILLFAGLFCAYAVYRQNHPEIFLYAHQFLDKQLGGINTVVLITSSFTMAMAVRTAQLGKRGITAGLLALTLLGGVGFLGIKAVEYEHKWKHGLLWGTKYQDQDLLHGTGEGEHSEPAVGGEHSLLETAPGVEMAHPADGATPTEPAIGAPRADAGTAAAHGADASPGDGHPSGEGTTGAAAGGVAGAVGDSVGGTSATGDGAAGTSTGDDTAPAIGDDTARAIGDDTARVLGDDAAPVIGDDAAPVIGDDAAPVIGDDAARVIGDDAAPVIGDDAAPVIGDDAARVIGDDAAPVIGDGTALVIGGEVMPHSTLPSGADQPQGIVDSADGQADEHAHPKKPSNVHIFFGIYFLMTGLHGIHVIAGMGAITWVLIRTLRGDFSTEYSTPVDLVGLYWHLVDLVWIYLFPLLYLIH